MLACDVPNVPVQETVLVQILSCLYLLFIYFTFYESLKPEAIETRETIYIILVTSENWQNYMFKAM